MIKEYFIRGGPFDFWVVVGWFGALGDEFCFGLAGFLFTKLPNTPLLKSEMVHPKYNL